MDNRTDKGAWTRAQLEVVGIKWPPSAGWISRLKGKEITEDQASEFIRCSKINAKGKTEIERLCLSVLNRKKELTVAQIKNMIEKLAIELEKR